MSQSFHKYTIFEANLFPIFSFLAIASKEPVPREEWSNWEGPTLLFDDVLFISMQESVKMDENVNCIIYVEDSILQGGQHDFNESSLEQVLDETFQLENRKISFGMDEAYPGELEIVLEKDTVQIKCYYTNNPNKIILVLSALR